jgi:NAD(P)-dependent dehydrogenase (short-subunit alcohol dehydrogenase family)
MSKVIFITGAGRGLGAVLAREALAAGHQVVAAGRKPELVEKALGGNSDNLLVVKLNITRLDEARVAVDKAIQRFGRIDVLINNAANFYAGYFEELSPEEIRAQFETNLFGSMNVTRAVLPGMRDRRHGHVLSISSIAGLVGQEFNVAYAASKFAVEGWMEALRYDLTPFDIKTTVVEPGYFRTELLEDTSTVWPVPRIADYADRTTSTVKAWKEINGQQPGDPVKLAQALLILITQEQPPFRFIAGADALSMAEDKVNELRSQIESSRELGANLAFDE